MATVNHTIVYDCVSLSEYNIVLAKVTLWNTNGNLPPVTITSNLAKKQVTVKYVPYTQTDI